MNVAQSETIVKSSFGLDNILNERCAKFCVVDTFRDIWMNVAQLETIVKSSFGLDNILNERCAKLCVVDDQLRC